MPFLRRKIDPKDDRRKYQNMTGASIVTALPMVTDLLKSGFLLLAFLCSLIEDVGFK